MRASPAMPALILGANACLLAVIASPAPAQTCNCTCDALIPPCYVISRFYMNESGGPPANPTMYLTAGIGTVPPTSAEVRHANRFGIAPGTTLTHVCIALKNPSGPAGTPCAGGDPAYIFIAANDPTTNLPGAFLGGTQTNFIVMPCVGLAIHHQLVAFSTPVSFPLGADIWVGVGYPTADVTIGHQGNRQSTGGSSAVWIGGSLSQWYSYNDPQLGSFNGRAPIIRALELTRGGGRVDASPATSLITDENGLSAQFQVFLASAPPTANVNIALASTNPAEGRPTVGSLTFTPLNWNIPQFVTVVGRDDPLVDGNIPYQVTGTATSADQCYNNPLVPAFSVNLTNLDNDGPCHLLWTQLAPATSPPARDLHAMAYDPVRQRIVLFGGLSTIGFPLSDTWEYDLATANWIARPTLGGPVARFGHAMAFDAASGQVVLYGGTDSTTYFADAWGWNGLAWSPLVPPPGVGRRWPAMSINPQSHDLMLCGGQDSTGASRPEVFEYALGTWILGPPMSAPGPNARASHAVANPWGGSAVFLFGGEDPQSFTVYGDTWQYGAGLWSQILGTSPSARRHHAMAPFRGRNAAAMFGGDSGPGAFSGETWALFLPVGWVVQQTLGLPSARSGHAMAAVDGDKRIILFGGSNLSGKLGDTWEMSDPSFPTITATGDIVVQTGNTFSQNVFVAGSGTFFYQWYKDGVPLSNGPRISGADAATLTIGPAILADSGRYWVVVSSPCGGFDISPQAIVDVNCTADWDNNHLVQVNDIFAYLAAWFAHDPRADISPPPGVDVGDIFAFLALWFAGCP